MLCCCRCCCWRSEGPVFFLLKKPYCFSLSLSSALCSTSSTSIEFSDWRNRRRRGSCSYALHQRPTSVTPLLFIWTRIRRLHSAQTQIRNKLLKGNETHQMRTRESEPTNQQTKVPTGWVGAFSQTFFSFFFVEETRKWKASAVIDPKSNPRN